MGRFEVLQRRLGGLPRWGLASALSVLALVPYVALPGGEQNEQRAALALEDGEGDEPLEVRSVSPVDPFPGSSIAIVFSGKVDAAQLRAYAGKQELLVLARREHELVARLPRELAPGDLKVRLASAGDEARPFHLRAWHSKPFHVRVRTPSWRKVYRSLLGGLALVAFGIGLLSRGVRAATGLHAARAATRIAERRSLAYAGGALIGALAQSTTGAAGILAALSAASVVPLSAAALAFVGAQLGATIAPLLVTGLVEPREGLLLVALGVLWLTLASDRRTAALGRLVLGAGFVAFGLQLFRPGLEPFLSEPLWIALGEQLRAESAGEVALCAVVGAALTAALQGPAPLVVLLLGTAQTTGHWDLRSALALLAGSGFGAALAAYLTVATVPASRKLARMHLVLGALGAVISASTVELWAELPERVLGGRVAILHWTERVPMSALGAELALGFGASQLAMALVLGLLVERLARRSASAKSVPVLRPAGDEAVRQSLGRVLALQQAALADTSLLAQAGTRRFGQRAEARLASARAMLAGLLDAQRGALALLGPESALLGSSAFSCLQLQHALETLLERAERGIDARLVASAEQPVDASADGEPVLRDLHLLIDEGLAATRSSLTRGAPLDLDDALAREIKINRLEAYARSALLERGEAPQQIARALDLLQVVDAYEVVGNHVYRLAEVLGQGFDSPPALQVS